MYKVFTNDSSFNLRPDATDAARSISTGTDLFELFLQLEKQEVPMHVVVQNHDPEKLWQDFISHFDVKEAAGGVVLSGQGNILMIYRWEKWDLPKGKLEKGESIAEGALREVEEECGISGMEITKELATTYHTYRIGETPVLKRTYWYEMDLPGEPELSPQEEEDITEARWCSKNEVRERVKNTYGNILLLLEAYIR